MHQHLLPWLGNQVWLIYNKIRCKKIYRSGCLYSLPRNISLHGPSWFNSWKQPKSASRKDKIDRDAKVSKMECLCCAPKGRSPLCCFAILFFLFGKSSFVETWINYPCLPMHSLIIATSIYNLVGQLQYGWQHIALTLVPWGGDMLQCFPTWNLACYVTRDYYSSVAVQLW